MTDTNNDSTPKTILSTGHVQPDAWRFGTDLTPDDSGFCDVRLPSASKSDVAYPVVITQTGFAVRRIPGSGGSLGYRVSIEWLQDGEPSTTSGGWVFED